MEALIVLALSFGLLWVLFLRPQQRRVRAHQLLVATLEEGDEVILSAGIFGRITRLGPEDLDLEVAPGVELRVARQAVLRRVEHAVPVADAGTGAVAATDEPATARSDAVAATDEPATARSGAVDEIGEPATAEPDAVVGRSGADDPADADEPGHLADATRTGDTA